MTRLGAQRPPRPFEKYLRDNAPQYIATPAESPVANTPCRAARAIPLKNFPATRTIRREMPIKFQDEFSQHIVFHGNFSERKKIFIGET